MLVFYDFSGAADTNRRTRPSCRKLGDDDISEKLWRRYFDDEGFKQDIAQAKLDDVWAKLSDSAEDALAVDEAARGDRRRGSRCDRLVGTSKATWRRSSS